MKPHIHKVYAWWACEIRLATMQRGQPRQLVVYSGTGATPAEAYERCQSVFNDRNKARQ